MDPLTVTALDRNGAGSLTHRDPSACLGQMWWMAYLSLRRLDRGSWRGHSDEAGRTRRTLADQQIRRIRRTGYDEAQGASSERFGMDRWTNSNTLLRRDTHV